MATLHAYLNYNGNCEEAFEFYQSVFDTQTMGVHRFGSLPVNEHMPKLSEDDKNKVMHTSIMINDQTMLMGSDLLPAFCTADMDTKVVFGNGTYVMLDTQSTDEAHKIYDRLSKGGKIEMPLGETDWAELYSSFRDKYDIAWMINFTGSKKM